MLTYWLARRLHGERTALFAAAILTVSFWHILDSVQINVENVFSLVLLITVIGYFHYLWKPTMRAAAIAGALLGLAFLTKYSAVLLAAAIGLHGLVMWWRRERPRVHILKEHAVLFGIPLAMLAAYFAVTLLFDSPYGSTTLQHGVNYLSGFLDQDLLNLLSIFIQAVFFISPLLLGLLVLGALAYDPKHRFFFILIGVFVVFYLIVLSASFRAFERFWAPLMPALAIIGGSFLSRVRWRQKDLVLSAAFALGSYLLLLAVQLTPATVYPLYPKAEYVARVLSFQWDFYVPFHTSTGPFGFFVEFGTLMLGFSIAALALAGYILFRRSRWSHALLLLFLGASLAYNVILAQEYLVSPTSPDVNGVSWEVHEYVVGNIPPERELLVYQLYGQYLLRHYGLEFFGYPADSATMDTLAQTDKVVVIVDYPVIPKDTEFWRLILACEKLASFSDKGVTMGYVFDCRNRNETALAGTA